MADGKLDVMGVAQSPVGCDELPAVTVVVGDSAVEDNEALRRRVVLAELRKIQIGVERVSLRCGGTSVNEDWLGRQRRGRGQRWWCLRRWWRMLRFSLYDTRHLTD